MKNDPKITTPFLRERQANLARRLDVLLAPTNQESSPTTSPAPPPEQKNMLLQRVNKFFSALFRVAVTRAETEEHSHRLASMSADVDRQRQDLDARHSKVARELEDQRRDLEGQRRDLVLDIDSLKRDLDGRAGALQRLLENQQSEIARLRAANSQFSRAYSDLTRRVDAAFYRLAPMALAAPAGNSPLRGTDATSRVGEVDGLEALLTTFYNTLQDRYRGSREEIMGRLQKYLPDVHAVVASSRKPVLDLGAGRGEWLELLTAEGLAAEGVDINTIQIGEAAAWNVVIHHDDFRQFLSKCPPASFAVISAFHLVEHLAFDTLTWLAREAMRVLVPGGLLLIETPNPRNVLVGATTFHADPTHIKPLSPEVLETLFESIGYDPVEVRFVHPHEKLDVFLREKRLDAEIAHLLFGAQDTAVLARKPVLHPHSTA